MMIGNKESIVACRVDIRLKRRVEVIFERLGMVPSQGIRLFLNLVSLHDGIPFVIKVPKDCLPDEDDEIISEETPEMDEDTRKWYQQMGFPTR